MRKRTNPLLYLLLSVPSRDMMTSEKVRMTLQRKGTRSAKRRLIARSVRERRFIVDVNHQISKDIAKPNSLIGLENLTGIRDRTRTKSGKKASKKRRRANRNKAKWSFAQLHGYINYKANLVGSLATKVDALTHRKVVLNVGIPQMLIDLAKGCYSVVNVALMNSTLIWLVREILQ
jgi:IS605 OrfB family transposase